MAKIAKYSYYCYDPFRQPASLLVLPRAISLQLGHVACRAHYSHNPNDSHVTRDWALHGLVHRVSNSSIYPFTSFQYWQSDDSHFDSKCGQMDRTSCKMGMLVPIQYWHHVMRICKSFPVCSLGDCHIFRNVLIWPYPWSSHRWNMQ